MGQVDAEECLADLIGAGSLDTGLECAEFTGRPRRPQCGRNPVRLRGRPWPMPCHASSGQCPRMMTVTTWFPERTKPTRLTVTPAAPYREPGYP